MKRILHVILCGVVTFSGILFFASAYTDKTETSSNLLNSMFYEDFEESSSNSEAAMRRTFGNELADAILNSELDGQVIFDLVNGDVKVLDCLPQYSVESTEAFIPDGLGVVEPFVGAQRANSKEQIEYPVVNYFPYCTNALLQVIYQDGSTHSASGVFVSDRIILTAGHVLYTPDTHVRASQIAVTPGGSLSKFNTVPATGMSISSNWMSNLAKDYDYGAICIDASQQTGYLGMSTKTDTQLKNLSLVGVYGYPSEETDEDGTLWYSSGTVDVVEPLIFSYTATTGGGFSGGPVVDMSNYKNVIGIHVAHNGVNPIATRINSRIIQFVQNFESNIA